jgi:hypothetical protein
MDLAGPSTEGVDPQLLKLAAERQTAEATRYKDLSGVRSTMRKIEEEKTREQALLWNLMQHKIPHKILSIQRFITSDGPASDRRVPVQRFDLSDVTALGGDILSWLGDPERQERTGQAVRQTERDLQGDIRRAEQWVSGGAQALAERADEIPVIGTVMDVAAQGADTAARLTGGAARRATNLAGGVASAAANPIGTARGLAEMTGRLAREQWEVTPPGTLISEQQARQRYEGSVQGQMIRGMTESYREDMERGNYVGMAGQAAFDAMLMLLPGALGARGISDAGQAARGMRIAEEAAATARAGEAATAVRTGEAVEAARGAAGTRRLPALVADVEGEANLITRPGVAPATETERLPALVSELDEEVTGVRSATGVRPAEAAAPRVTELEGEVTQITHTGEPEVGFQHLASGEASISNVPERIRLPEVIEHEAGEAWRRTVLGVPRPESEALGRGMRLGTENARLRGPRTPRGREHGAVFGETPEGEIIPHPHPTGGGENWLAPNWGDLGPLERPWSELHTHPTPGLATSGRDLARPVLEPTMAPPVEVVQSGQSQFVTATTREWSARQAGLTEAGRTELARDIDALYNVNMEEAAAAGATSQEATRAALANTADVYQMAAYESTGGGELTRMRPREVGVTSYPVVEDELSTLIAEVEGEANIRIP